MASRNQREGRYVGRLAASSDQPRLHFRSRLTLHVGPDSAMIALLHRSAWLIDTPSGPGWRLASRRRTKLSRRGRRQGSGTARSG